MKPLNPKPKRPQWREWTAEDRMKSAARAANLHMNMVTHMECGLPWPEGLIHDGCPGPAPAPKPPTTKPTNCEGAVDCNWLGIVTIVIVGAGRPSWRACREHAAPFRAYPEQYTVIDTGQENVNMEGRKS